MEKMNINKLIANDIINWGRERTTGRDYSIFLEEGYLDEFDDDTKKYIRDNQDLILEDIKNNSNVYHMQYLEDKDLIDIIFEYDFCLNQIEQKVNDTAEIMNANLQLEDIQSIANDVLEDDGFNDDLINKITSYHKHDSMEM